MNEYYSAYMAETVRIAPEAHACLAEIARAKHLSLTEALSRAVEAYRREVFMEQMATGYAALRNDSKAWSAEHAEREAWDTTSRDGLADE